MTAREGSTGKKRGKVVSAENDAVSDGSRHCIHFDTSEPSGENATDDHNTMYTFQPSEDIDDWCVIIY